jgi:hypothetical protein
MDEEEDVVAYLMDIRCASKQPYVYTTQHITQQHIGYSRIPNTWIDFDFSGVLRIWTFWPWHWFTHAKSALASRLFFLFIVFATHILWLTLFYYNFLYITYKILNFHILTWHSLSSFMPIHGQILLFQ